MDREVRVRLKPAIKDKALEAGLSPTELADMVKNRDPALKTVTANDEKRAKALESSLSPHARRILMADLQNDLDVVETNHMGPKPKPIDGPALGQDDEAAIASDGKVIEKRPDGRTLKRQLRQSDVDENPAIADASSIGPGMPVDETAGKSPSIIDADQAAKQASEKLAAREGDIAKEAAELASTVLGEGGRLTQPQGDEISSAADSVDPKDLVNKSRISRLEAKAAEGLTDLSSSASAGDVSGVEEAATVIDDSANAASEDAERVQKSLWQSHMGAAEQRRALESADQLMKQTPLGKIEGFGNADLIDAASKASQRLMGEEGEKPSSAAILEQSAEAVKTKDGNYYSGMLLMELMQNPRVQKRPDIIQRLEDMLTEKPKPDDGLPAGKDAYSPEYSSAA
ncbi:MAG: hypothetical protein V1875_05385 [Candidatus Altiarchaeota archaeon]